ncbi:transporter [Polaribacter tangerinus]|uniref:transporter n=1 Tax=Polaribacter tangerinus TaxID=1920034 RepID=UPI00117DE220|nr:transporter [Polaribacter tangerinus]
MTISFDGFSKKLIDYKSDNILNNIEYYFCDICGSSANGASFGIGTISSASFIGVRYMYQSYTSKDGIFVNSPSTKEHFSAYQLWGKIPVNSSIYISAVMPYQDLERRFSNKTEAVSGFGDAIIMGWYQLKLFKQSSENNTNLIPVKETSNHSLEFGFGVKLPTGKFEQVLANRVNPGFQVGTGSLDVVLALSHGFNKNNFGLSTSLTYYLKGENKNEYRFGNQFSYRTNLFYTIAKDNFSFLPFIGFSGDVYNPISQYKETIKNTSGDVFNGILGAETIFNKAIVGVNYTLPIHHNLFNGNVTPNSSLSVYLNFSLE